MAEIIFSKYSNERSRKFAIRTDILQDGQERFVRKTALYQEGRDHVNKLLSWYEKLEELYRTVSLSCNRCTADETGVRLEYLEGRTLEEVLDELLEKGMVEEARETFVKYLSCVKTIFDRAPFQKTEEFCRVFGDEALPDGLTGAPVTNIDMVCGNLVLTKPAFVSGIESGNWDTSSGNPDVIASVLDYEWTFDFPVPCQYVLYRIIHYYTDTHKVRSVLGSEKLCGEFGITMEQIRAFEQMELHFQEYITGSHVPMREMFRYITPGVNTVQTINSGQLQVFFSYGNSYREEHSVTLPMESGEAEHTIGIPKGCTHVRIDPGEQACAVHIRELTMDGHKLSLDTCVIPDGVQTGDWIYIAKDDPNVAEIPVAAETREMKISVKTYGASKELMKQVVKLAEENRELQSKVEQQSRLINDMKNTRVWKMYQKYRNMAERKK